jgi:hypothetical protein
LEEDELARDDMASLGFLSLCVVRSGL